MDFFSEQIKHHRREKSDVIMSSVTHMCPGCGCVCNNCFSRSSNLDLHQEIESLESQLRKSNSHITQIEHELMDCKQTAGYEVLKQRDDLCKLRDRYDRLFESHKRIQKVNHGLEDKLLKVVNGFESEKLSLQRELAAITSKLIDAKILIGDLEEENDRYRNDCNVAVQLLQCKPSNFVAHKLNSLPIDLQERVKKHMTREEIINCEDAPEENETKLIRVPMQTFPPTAMVYSINNSQKKTVKDATDTVPMNLIAKVLTPQETSRKHHRTYICVKCKCDVKLLDKEVQVSREITSNHVGSVRVHKPSGRIRNNSTETEIQ